MARARRERRTRARTRRGSDEFTHQGRRLWKASDYLGRRGTILDGVMRIMEDEAHARAGHELEQLMTMLMTCHVPRFRQLTAQLRSSRRHSSVPRNKCGARGVV